MPQTIPCARFVRAALVAAALAVVPLPLQGQTARAGGAVTDYVVGPQDVLVITSYDQADLSGKFTVEADGTFTFPLIGRFRAGGLTLRQVEDGLKKAFKDGQIFTNPQVTVSVEQYRSQKVFVVGEVRTPGSYPVSGDMTLVEALARAGSTLPSASGEVIIVRQADGARPAGPVLPAADDANTIRVDLRSLQHGAASGLTALRDGDTIFVPRAESIYVYGEVKTPGAYTLQHRDTTVLQALSLAGGVSPRGASGRIRIIRLVDGEKQEIRVTLTDRVLPGDTIVVPERFL